MKAETHVRYRNSICGALLLAALGSVPVAAETVRAGGFDRFMSLTTGAGSQTLTFSGAGVPVLTDTHTGGSKVGNMGVYAHPSTPGALEVRGSGTLGVGGRTVPFKAKGMATARNVGKAVGGLLTGPAGIALLAIPAIIDLLTDSNMTYDPATRTVNQSGQYWHVYSGSCLYKSSPTEAALCGAMATWSGTTAADWNCNVTTVHALSTDVHCSFNGIPASRSYSVGVEKGAAWGGPRTAQQIEDAIATSGVTDPAVLAELYSKGQPVELEPLQVTDVPSTVQGPSSVAVAPNGDTTTTDRVWQCTTTGNLVACNQVETKTTQRAGLDPVTGLPYEPEVSTETSDDTAPDPDSCAADPSRVGCAQLDTPTGEIPRDTEEVTFEAEDRFGEGQCPADVMATFGTLGGQSFMLWDWQKLCTMALPIRAIVVLLASFAAMLIVTPGRTEI